MTVTVWAWLALGVTLCCLGYAGWLAGRVVRGFTAWALQKHAGLTQRQIAERFGVTLAGFVRSGRVTIYSQPQRISELSALSDSPLLQ